MPLKKINNAQPYNNIRKWLYEQEKTFAPNPLKPNKMKTTKKKEIGVNNLAKILNRTHRPGGLIDQIIDEIDKLLRRVETNERDIDSLERRATKLEQRVSDLEFENQRFSSQYQADQAASRTERMTKSMIGHMHPPNAGGPVGPSFNKKGGKLQRGGRTKPKVMRRGRKRVTDR